MIPAATSVSSTAGPASGQEPLRTLVAALREPSRYPHPADEVEVIETHISFVLLAGEFAYKLKKPVDLGFLDFRSLADRRHFCEEELRLNRRTAPALYLEVVPIAGGTESPVLGGDGPPIEYALKMRRFSQDLLFDRMARDGTLTPAHVDALAEVVAHFHAAVGRADTGSPFGTARRVLSHALQNFDQAAALIGAERARDELTALRTWTVEEYPRRSETIARRHRAGFVRECHGDLHLGNIALIEGTPTPFDCIEFDPELRWIDVASEIAFLVMDLLDHDVPALAWRCLDAYLQVTGDYEGVELLRFFLVYRAMVRAKVALIRDRQTGIATDSPEHAGAFRGHVDLARRISNSARPAIVLMHGLSGSGKSTVAQTLLEGIGAIRMRSDVERKRRHGLPQGQRTRSGLDGGMYSAAANADTYDHLAAQARTVVRAGWPVVVDAAFLRRADRESFRALARRESVPFVIVWCEATEDTLRERVEARERRGDDASEAGLAVLERQRATCQPLAADERPDVIAVATDAGAAPTATVIAQVARRISPAGM